MAKSKIDSVGLVTDAIGTDILKGSVAGFDCMGAAVLGA